MVDIPLDKLLEIGWADLRKNQAHFNQVARNWSRTRIRAPCWKNWARIIPRPINCWTRSAPRSTAWWLSSARIISSPFPRMCGRSWKRRRPSCAPRPLQPWIRRGRLRRTATEAYFNVTLPDPSMTPAEVEGYMHSFNVGTVISTAVHEAYPGHYVQFLWLPQAPSRVRKLLGANTDVEGWAHYCEQMMLDEGYGQPGAGRKGRARSEVAAPRPVAGCAAARRALHRRHRNAHRQDELSTRPSSSSRRKATSRRRRRSSRPSAAPAIPPISTTRWASLKS